jgi:PIN domain nuclease of toxin-antitoxin system
LKIDFDPVDLAKQSGFELLDFSGRDALLLQAMPFHHKDPFDIIFYYRVLNLTFMFNTAPTI